MRDITIAARVRRTCIVSIQFPLQSLVGNTGKSNWKKPNEKRRLMNWMRACALTIEPNPKASILFVRCMDSPFIRLVQINCSIVVVGMHRDWNENEERRNVFVGRAIDVLKEIKPVFADSDASLGMHLRRRRRNGVKSMNSQHDLCIWFSSNHCVERPISTQSTTIHGYCSIEPVETSSLNVHNFPPTHWLITNRVKIAKI